MLVLDLAILSCCFCSLYSCCRCALVSIFFFSNEVLILNTTSMICHTQEQNYFLSELQERKRTEACLCKKVLDKTVLKAVPFWNSFRITQFNLSFTDILQKGGGFLSSNCNQTIFKPVARILLNSKNEKNFKINYWIINRVDISYFHFCLNVSFSHWIPVWVISNRAPMKVVGQANKCPLSNFCC